MKKPASKAIARRFDLQSLLILEVALLVIFYILLRSWDLQIEVLLSLLILFLHSYIQRLHVTKTLHSIVTKDMDAKTFRSVWQEIKTIAPSWAYDFLALSANGDYHDAIALCCAKISRARTSYAYNTYMPYLARLYFELNDDVRLGRVLKHWAPSAAMSQAPRKTFTVSFYEAYLDGRYDECLTHCQKRLQSIASQPLSYERICLMLWQGMIYERMGDIDAAREQLTFVRDHAPRVYASTLAQIHLDALEQGTPLQAPIAEIEPTPEDMTAYASKLRRRFGRFVLTFLLPFALITLLFWGGLYSLVVRML